MSYCRFAWGGSDVYVFESDRGIYCCGCRFQEDFVTNEPEEMIAHLARHRRAGHFVPSRAIEALWLDIPGAQRPADGEPPTMTHANIMFAIAELQHAMEKAEKRRDAKDAADEALLPVAGEAPTADAVRLSPDAETSGIISGNSEFPIKAQGAEAVPTSSDAETKDRKLEVSSSRPP